MKKFKKIILSVLSAAVALAWLMGITALAAEAPVTGAQLKTMAESVTLSQNPDAKEILAAPYEKYDPDALIGEQKTETVGDYIDPDAAVLLPLYQAINFTQKFREGNGGAKSFAEAIKLCESGFYTMEYYQMTEPFYDEHGVLVNSRHVQTVYQGDGSLLCFLNPAYQLICLGDESFDSAADIINQSDISEVTGVYLFMNEIGIDTDKGSFMIILGESVTDGGAAYLGKDSSSLEVGKMYSVLEYDTFYSLMNQNSGLAADTFQQRLREAMGGILGSQDEVEEAALNPGEASDSFSKYIGAEPLYSDVTTAQAAVTNQLSDLGIITGENGMFCPDSDVTRAEAAAMLCRMFEISPGGGSSFSDVPMTHWASGYIGALSDIGVINGFEDGSFRPDDSVTYEQAVKMIESLLGYTEEFTMTDAEYPTGILIVASKLGLTDDLGSFDSGAPATRIDMACMLSRALDSRIIVENLCLIGHGIGATSYADITLAQWRDGAEPNGDYLKGGKAKKEYYDAVNAEIAEKCGDIIKKYSEATGLLSGEAGISARITSGPAKSNPIPRIN